MRRAAIALGVAIGSSLLGLALPGGGAGAIGVGGTCGGGTNLGCNGALWCQLDAGRCGLADAEGQCVSVPQACNLAYRPVCGCNGRTYGNDCERTRARVQKAHDGSCGFHRRTRPPVEPDARDGGH